MSENKKKAAAIGVVKAIVSECITQAETTPTQNENWSLWGRQTIMLNRNIVQLRPSHKAK
ncbi:MAG: hypothetical protein FWG98_10820 [Candidatus Cloacimonetes bacterium]|nr:hypothetical protein [Candidatus Cloacimonadota bacterium]